MARIKFLNIVNLNQDSIGPVICFLANNTKLITSLVINDNKMVTDEYVEILYNLVEKTYKMDPLSFEKVFTTSKTSELKPSTQNTKYEDLVIILDSLLGLFPRIQTKYVNKISALVNMFYLLSTLGNEMNNYLLSRKAIFVFITYFLGKDSPCFQDTLLKPNDSWGVNRGYIAGPDSMTNMVYNLYNYVTKNNKGKKQRVIYSL